MRAFFLAAALYTSVAYASPATSVANTTELTVREADSTCSGASLIDIEFYDGVFSQFAFAFCTGASASAWSDSSTPDDFSYCRTSLDCSSGDNTHEKGVCVRGSAYCVPAEDYCNKLGGYFRGTFGC